ncbi:MAG: hypothetical protein V1906_02790 [Candidatus Woesearchaeota archaeon]
MRRVYNSDIYGYHPKVRGYVDVCRMIEEELVGLPEVSMPLAHEDFPDSYTVRSELTSLEKRVGALCSFLSSLGVDVGGLKAYLDRMSSRKEAYMSPALRVVMESSMRTSRRGKAECTDVMIDDLDKVDALNPRYR